MAVHREAGQVGIRHALAHGLEQVEILVRRRVADGVGNVDGGGAGLDRGLDAAAQEIEFRAGAVLARPLDVVGMVARPGDLRDHHLVDLVRLLLQLVLHVHRRGRQEGVDAPARRRLDRLGAAVDVLGRGAGEPADHGILGALGDLMDGGEVALRGDRKAGLDDVDAHVVEQFGDLELLLVGHGGAGALLAVAQGGVENDDAVLLGLGRGGHGLNSFWSRAGRGAPGSAGFFVKPLSAQAQAPSRPSEGDKEQQPVENEGSTGPSLVGSPSDREIVANRHARPRRPQGGADSVKSALILAAAAVVWAKRPPRKTLVFGYNAWKRQGG